MDKKIMLVDDAAFHENDDQRHTLQKWLYQHS